MSKLDEGVTNLEDQRPPDWLDLEAIERSELPVVLWQIPDSYPSEARIACLSWDRPELAAGWFLLDALWDHLGKKESLRLKRVRSFAAPLRLGTGVGAGIEVQLSVRNGDEAQALRQALPRFRNEIAFLGTCPSYRNYFGRSPWAPEPKVRELQRLCAAVHQRWPQESEGKLKAGLEQFLLLTHTDFRMPRSARHMCRIITTVGLFNQQLKSEARRHPKKRHLRLRLFPADLTFPFGRKRVFGLVVAVNIDSESEQLGQPHLLRALRSIIPDIVAVEGSYITHHPSLSSIRSLYLEIEHSNARELETREIARLRRELTSECKGHIEPLANAVFVHRNEEEVFRSILTLSRELRYVKDLPQVILWFEGQDDRSLTFNVILLRLLTPGSLSTSEKLQALPPEIECSVDEVKIVGTLRKRHAKEAAVFRMRFPKDPFLRKNYSIDLYRAREYVGRALTRLFGEIRDYNGGLILKRNEVLEGVKRRLRPHERKQEHLLENLFFGLIPSGIQSCMPARAVLELFRMVLRGVEEQAGRKSGYHLNMRQLDRWMLAVIVADDPSFRAGLLEELSQLSQDPFDRGSTWSQLDGAWYLGYAIQVRDSLDQDQFRQAIKSWMERWARDLPCRQRLRINLLPEGESLDPRIGTGRRSGVMMKMLYEGLTRIGKQGRAELAIAEHVDISEDLRTYTFYLRESYWSNGIPLTAHDFEYAWKKTLDPNFESRYTYRFCPIKNALKAERGEVLVEQLGVYCANSRKLVVELEHPAPYFLELTAHWTYSPLWREIDQLSPGWAQASGEGYICNGPFKLAGSRCLDEVHLIKNKCYWDAGRVRLEQIDVNTIDDPNIAWALFERGELDLLGEPISELPTSVLVKLRDAGRLDSVPASAIYWYKINTARPPFNSRKVRRAFGIAIDRQKVIDRVHVLKGDQQPAFSIVPPDMSFLDRSLLVDGDVETARRLFQEGLAELGLSHADLAPIVLCYRLMEGEREVAEEVAEQWRSAFHLSIDLRGIPWRHYLDHILKQEFHLAAITWYCLLNDPIYNFEHLKYKGQFNNATSWEHPEYQRLLEEADACVDLGERRAKLRAVEALFLEEMPLLPLYCPSYRFARRVEAKGVYVSPLGYVDFKEAHIE